MISELTDKHFLLPSTIFAEKKHHRIDTILGSCVAICLWDPKLKIGGMNHYMLPLWNGEGLASPKFGNIAIDRMIKKMMSEGCQKKNMQAKVFGGKGVSEGQLNCFKIGDRNAEI